METRLKIERLLELRSLIEAQPEPQIRLNAYQVSLKTGGIVEAQRADDVPLCDSIVCICGAAWLHPPFVAAGIRRFSPWDRWTASNQFFGVPEYLFSTRKYFENVGEFAALTDKEVALRRIDAELARAYAVSDAEFDARVNR